MNKPNYFKYGFTLFIVCAISALGVTFVYLNTKTEIIRTQELRIKQMQKKLLPSATSFMEITKTITECFDEHGNSIGHIVFENPQGYGGLIEMAVGIDKKREIVGLKILKHKETPGLGTRVFRDDFLGAFLSLGTTEQIFLKKDDPRGIIDAITGATATSRAVTQGVREAVEKVKE